MRSAGLLLLFTLCGCSSVETMRVKEGTLVSSVGEPVAVIQASSVGFTLFFHLVDIVTSDLDDVVNRLMMAEAKAMGASRVELKSAHTTPRGGIFALTGFLVGFPTSEAVGVAVKAPSPP